MANSKKTSTTRSSKSSTGKKTAGRASSSRKAGKKIGKKAISKTSVPRPQNAASSPDTQPAADSSTSAAQPPASNSIPESAAEPATGPAAAASISAVPGWLGLLLGLLACAALLLLAVSKGTDYFTTADADARKQQRTTAADRT